MERIEDGAAFDQRRLLHKPPCSNLDSIQHHGRKGLGNIRNEENKGSVLNRWLAQGEDDG